MRKATWKCEALQKVIVSSVKSGGVGGGGGSGGAGEICIFLSKFNCATCAAVVDGMYISAKSGFVQTSFNKISGSNVQNTLFFRTLFAGKHIIFQGQGAKRY